MRWPIWREHHLFTAPTSACRSLTTASTISSTPCSACRSNRSWRGLLKLFYRRLDCFSPLSGGGADPNPGQDKSNRPSLPPYGSCDTSWIFRCWLFLTFGREVHSPRVSKSYYGLTSKAVAPTYPHEPLERSCTVAMFTAAMSLLCDVQCCDFASWHEIFLITTWET